MTVTLALINPSSALSPQSLLTHRGAGLGFGDIVVLPSKSLPSSALMVFSWIGKGCRLGFLAANNCEKKALSVTAHLRCIRYNHAAWSGPSRSLFCIHRIPSGSWLGDDHLRRNPVADVPTGVRTEHTLHIYEEVLVSIGSDLVMLFGNLKLLEQVPHTQVGTL